MSQANGTKTKYLSCFMILISEKKIKPKVTEGIKNVISNRESTQKILIRDDSRAQACGRRMGNPGSQRM